jgi:PBP1b-binding outer membrane lipoprotein LpoB
MKKFIAIMFAGAFLASCGAEQQSTEEGTTDETEEVVEAIQTVEGFTHFGVEEVPMEKAISVDSFATAFADGATNSYTIKAELASICAKAGCFVIVTLPDSVDMRVMFKDHFTIPTDTEIGTTAIFTGEAKMDTTSIEDLQHYIMDEMEGEGVSEEKKAELQKKHDAVIAPVFEPIFIASGILVKD